MDEIVSRFRGKLVKTIRDAGSKFDDYSISSKERYKNLSQKEKDSIKEYQRKKYQELVQYKKEALKIIFYSFLNIKNEWKDTKIQQY